MKLENQVSSQALSKKLCELGISQDRQEASAWWAEEKSGGWNRHDWREVLTTDLYEGDYNEYRNEIRAFTVAELGAMFPDGHFETMKQRGWWCKWFDNGLIKQTHAKTEADARAKMLIYLIKNEIITL